MKITGARVALDANHSEHRDLYVHQGRISYSNGTNAHEAVLDLRGFLLLPGLINAHDHLEFNLFPKLGCGPYLNARDWAVDIHRPGESPVKQHLALSKSARLLWGGLKNLLSGVTTVAHHNACDHARLDQDFPVSVVKRFGWAHSLDFSPDLTDRFRATPPDWPFILHAAEGIDEHAGSEIARLDRLGVLSDRTALVHALGVDHPGLELLRARRSSIVWCPSSNLATYGRTLGDSVLRSDLNVALGTDSAMTAQGDLRDEIGVARSVSNFDSGNLYELVTTSAAKLLRLSDGQGVIRENGVADLVAVPDRKQSPAEALREMEPELVMSRGAVRLVTARLLDRLPERDAWRHAVELEGRGRWFTGVDIPALHEETVGALGPEYRLAGRRVWP